MKNREKFKDELIDVMINGTDESVERFFNKHIEPFYHSGKYHLLTSENVAVLINLWLDEEYKEPEVDWSKVPVDTPILVSTNEQHWYPRYFASYSNETVYAFKDGTTSWTTCGKNYWPYAKLAEPQKSKHNGCVGCKYEHFEENQEPCKNCQYAYVDKYEPQE